MRRPATIAAQAAGQINRATGGTVGSIETATTFERGPDYALFAGDIYRRDDNATVREAEAVITALEGAAATALYASGLAAIAALMRSASGPILVQSATYYGTQVLAQRLASTGLAIQPVDTADPEALRAACASLSPSLVMIETPSNPFLSLVDIAACAEIAHAGGALLAVDSTAATPIHTRPLALGADIVVHSATKALNGHSDVLAGSISVRDETMPLWQNALALRGAEGAVLSGFDAYLLTRGMRTLALRTEASSRSALHIAQWLGAHHAVAAVRYPGLPGHPGHAIAARQMENGFGHLLSFDVAGGAREALTFLSRLTLIKRATSLGGVESLIEHRHTIEPEFTGMPPSLIRLSVGIEAVEDLIEDLAEGLAALA